MKNDHGSDLKTEVPLAARSCDDSGTFKIRKST